MGPYNGVAVGELKWLDEGPVELDDDTVAWSRWSTWKGKPVKDNRSWSQDVDGNWFIRKHRGSKKAGGRARRERQERTEANAAASSAGPSGSAREVGR
jgi:hypothetical protein